MTGKHNLFNDFEATGAKVKSVLLKFSQLSYKVTTDVLHHINHEHVPLTKKEGNISVLNSQIYLMLYNDTLEPDHRNLCHR